MKIIAHRGNIYGPNPYIENNPEYLLNAVKHNFDVEVDVWYIDNNYFLGHDEPIYKVSCNFLKQLPGWFHAKNKKAFEQLKEDDLHYFWHQTDNFTLTSKGIPWCYPGFSNKNGIAVINENKQLNIKEINAIGICTDYPLFYKSELIK